MKDFILLLFLLGSGVNLIVADRASDFFKCVYLLSFLVAIVLWLVYSRQGRYLVKTVGKLYQS